MHLRRLHAEMEEIETGDIEVRFIDAGKSKCARGRRWVDSIEYLIQVRHKSGFSWVVQQEEPVLRSVNDRLQAVFGTDRIPTFPDAPEVPSPGLFSYFKRGDDAESES